MRVIHYTKDGQVYTCSSRSYGKPSSSDPRQVTCKRCLEGLASQGPSIAQAMQLVRECVRRSPGFGDGDFVEVRGGADHARAIQILLDHVTALEAAP